MSNDTQYEVQLTVAESFSSYYACDPSYYAYKTLLTMHVALLPHLLCMWHFHNACRPTYYAFCTFLVSMWPYLLCMWPYLLCM